MFECLLHFLRIKIKWKARKNIPWEGMNASLNRPKN